MRSALICGALALVLLAGVACANESGDEGEGEDAVVGIVETPEGDAGTATSTPETATNTRPAGPTRTPTPAPTATPTPIVLSGSGNEVTPEFVLEDGLWIAAVEYGSARNFMVWDYVDGERDDILVNVIGAYSGRRPLGPGSHFLEVSASGPWTVSITRAPTDDAVATEGFSGNGDDVSPLFTGEGTAVIEFSHHGSDNFFAWVHCTEGSDLVANEFGEAEGSAVADIEGVCYWEVQADGDWSLSPR